MSEGGSHRGLEACVVPPAARVQRGALLAVALGVLAVYAPVARYGWSGLDDDYFVVSNEELRLGLSWSGVQLAFQSTRLDNWLPLTWLSLLVDYELWGLWPGGYHLTNVGLHVANAMLLFAALRRLTGAPWRSLCVAALFAVHPLHVESVAWIAERKDVLSGLFWMLALFAHARYAQAPSAPRYGAVALCLALGLLAKPTLVTLPLVLLLLDFWPLRRLTPGADSPQRALRRLASLLVEKIPLLLLSGASSVITLFAQAGFIEERIPISQRLANAALAYVGYLLKAFWPADLAVMYPHPRGAISLLLALLAAALLAVLSLLAVRAGAQRPYLPVGWFWYLGTLVPVIGLVQVGRQAMADRYAYLPLIGIYVCVAWGAADLARALRLGWATRVAAALLVLVGFSLVSSRQVEFWRDAESVYRRAADVNPEDHWARMNLGASLVEKERLPEAEQQFRAAIALRPDEPTAYVNLGKVAARQRRLDEAIGLFERALELRPGLTEARLNLALALGLRGRNDEARAHALRAFEEAPDDPRVRELRERLGL